MTIKEIALNYDVPMPETCQKLDWKKETLFYWIKHKDWKEWHIKFYKEIQITLLEYKGEYKVLPAPNAQELFEALPESIKYENEDPEIGLIEWYLSITKQFVCYECSYENFSETTRDIVFDIKIQNNNLTQAFAEMYILLREKGLLPTT